MEAEAEAEAGIEQMGKCKAERGGKGKGGGGRGMNSHFMGNKKPSRASLQFGLRRFVMLSTLTMHWLPCAQFFFLVRLI